MTQGHTVSTHTEDLHVEVRLDGQVVASSQRPVLLEETGLPTAYYFPKADLVADTRLLELSPKKAPRTSRATWPSSPTGRKSWSTVPRSNPSTADTQH
jgi:hypothetical protein